MLVQATVEEVYHPNSWGWPQVKVNVHPSVGEFVLLPATVYGMTTPGKAVVISDDGHEVRLGVGKPATSRWGSTDYPVYAALRMSSTCDGLYLQYAGTENDGWSCVVKRNGPPGKRTWQVLRGRKA